MGYNLRPTPDDWTPELGYTDFWGQCPNSPLWASYVRGAILDLTTKWADEWGDPILASTLGEEIYHSLNIGDLPMGVTDHGELSGLPDDDHQQYYNQARGDARYPLISHTHRVMMDRVSMGAGVISTIPGRQWTSLNPESVTGFLGGTLVNNDYNVAIAGWYQINAKVTIYSPVNCAGATMMRYNGNDWQPCNSTLVTNSWQTLTVVSDVAYLPANSKLRLAIYFDNDRSDNTYVKHDPWSSFSLTLLERTT